MDVPDQLIGRRFGKAGRLQIRRKIGEGGMGAVYAAWDQKHDRTVAVKFLRPERVQDSEFRARFKHEGRRIRELRHDNLVKVYGLAFESGLYFIVSEYIDGRDLGHILDQDGALEVARAMQIARQIAQGLQVAHENLVIHRDLKPENVLISDAGEVKVADFGIAKYLDSSSVLTLPGTFVGTVGYAAPEQVEGKSVDARADIFALGAVLYELLTGTRAFRGRHTRQIIRSTLESEPIPVTRFNDGVVTPLTRLIDRMLHKRPTRRPESMDAVVAALDDVSAKIADGTAEERRGVVGMLKKLFDTK